MIAMSARRRALAFARSPELSRKKLKIDYGDFSERAQHEVNEKAITDNAWVDVSR